MSIVKKIFHILKKHFDAESEVPKEERSNSGYYVAAAESACRAFTSKFNSEHEVGYEELLAGADMLRMERVPKNYLIDDNNKNGKKKLSWQGQVTLKGSCIEACDLLVNELGDFFSSVKNFGGRSYLVHVQQQCIC